MLSLFLFAAVQHLINELPKSYPTHTCTHTYTVTVTDTVTDTVSFAAAPADTDADVDSHRLRLSQLLLHSAAWVGSRYDGRVSRLQSEIKLV